MVNVTQFQCLLSAGSCDSIKVMLGLHSQSRPVGFYASQHKEPGAH